MKLSPETLEILQNFSTINNSMYMDEVGYIKTKTPNSSNIIGVAKIKEELPEIAIYALDELLGAFSLMDKEKIQITFSKDYIDMSDGAIKIKYRLSDPKHILTKCKAVEDYDAFDKFNFTFTLSDNNLKTIRKASSVLSADLFSVKSKDGKGKITLANSEIPMSNMFELDIETSGEGEIKSFVENIMIVNGDYTVSVANDTVLKFTHKDFPVYYFVAASV